MIQETTEYRAARSQSQAALFFPSLPLLHSGKSREKILNLLLHDNTLTAIALAERIGITPKAVEKQIAALKAEGLLKRIGPDKGGHWQVVEGSSGSDGH